MASGLKCHLYGNITLDKCSTCPVPCHPEPALSAILEGSRTPVRGVYSVTELPNSYKSVYLSRNNPFYVKPYNLLPAAIGTAWHEKVAKHKNPRYLVEQYFEVEINGLTLRGQPDLYDTKLRILWDFKNIGYYPTRLMIDGQWDEVTYRYQMNAYHHFKFPEAKELWLDIAVRDWVKNIAAKYGIPRWLKIQVPFVPFEEILAYVTERITRHAEIQESGNPPDCTPDEMWMNNKGRLPNYCLDYCGGADFCEQFQQWKKDNDWKEEV